MIDEEHTFFYTLFFYLCFLYESDVVCKECEGYMYYK